MPSGKLPIDWVSTSSYSRWVGSSVRIFLMCPNSAVSISPVVLVLVLVQICHVPGAWPASMTE